MVRPIRVLHTFYICTKQEVVYTPYFVWYVYVFFMRCMIEIEKRNDMNVYSSRVEEEAAQTCRRPLEAGGLLRLHWARGNLQWNFHVEEAYVGGEKRARENTHERNTWKIHGLLCDDVTAGRAPKIPGQIQHCVWLWRVYRCPRLPSIAAERVPCHESFSDDEQRKVGGRPIS